MVIRRFHLAFAALTLAISFGLYAATERITTAWEFGLAFLGATLVLFDTEAREFISWLIGILEPPMLIDGQPLDPAKQNSLRHEAGMRPLRC